ncbi:hypothetical protein PDESU_01368 [Pontiella desulfatans]|uniref:Rhamnogalacturonase A/B/Epimerase-like pectate lyase domain-containing protein n=1 Tax=Pontiella desulfatans TaxID=2750659 RepID=A0A6C2TZC2_PONDE|nr:glycosyl hydrolase family 28-related protein [Pontiella desulfatans]VGO12814.1 hypothetical protein PDESU_01368 [Pontiella desulfatans]
MNKYKVIVAALLGAISVQAVDYTVSNSGAWDNAANWKTATAPVNDSTAKIFSKSGETITLYNSATIGFLALNDGDASLLSVVIDGGSLRSDNDGNGAWNAIGYNKSSSIEIKNGGSWICDGRVDVGLFDNVSGQVNAFTMTANSGDVIVSNDFSIGRSFDGSHSATATADILGGTLNIGGSLSFAGWGTCTMNIAGNGTVIIDGDMASEVQNFIQDGKIIANSGSGTPLVDYNATTPGKTTIRAIAGIVSPNWYVADALYTTNEYIITPFDALADFGIVGDGTTDVTDEIQDAMIVIANLGGGALYLPEGHYKVTGNLTIPSGVTLRGDWKKPEPGLPIVGTVLMAYAGRDDADGQYFITLSGSGGVNGVSVWYPEQLATDVRPYPITFGNGGAATIENITLVNAYFGFSSYRDGTTGRPFVRNIYGTPLGTGIEFDSIADIGRIESVHFSPDYWEGSDLSNAPAGGEHRDWLYNNATGIVLRRLDWSYSSYVTVEGYHIGLAMRPSRWDGKAPNGQAYDYHLIDCKTGIYIEKNLYNGEQFTRFSITGAETGVYMGPDNEETSMFHSCDIEATGAAFYCEGSTARAMIMSCEFDGLVQFDGGYLSVINSDFTNDGAHLVLGPGCDGASILGNTFTGDPRIVDNTDYPVEIDHTAMAVADLPDYDFKKPEKAYMPGTSNLYVVTEAPFNAAADGTTDDTAAFASALAAAQSAGGGTVFVPGGNYRLDGTLTVPTGVELRGIFDIPHGTATKGSLLNIYFGHNDANGTPFIQVSADAGVKGLNFHWPNQIYDAADTNWFGFVPYPFMVQGRGADVYVVNISATIPYQLLDLKTYTCDNHYVDYIFSTCLKTGITIGNGSNGGQLHNVQFNPNSYTFRYNEYDSIPSGTANDVHDLQWRYADPYLFGHVTNQVVHECFVFAGVRGIHLYEENGQGPSGHCLGFGADACTTAFLVDDVGDGGFEPINTQIVSTNPDNGHYFETGAGLDDEFRMFSGAAWGAHEYSAVIRGGDVELQNLLIQRDGTSGTYLIENSATVETYASSLDNKQNNIFLTIDPTASILFAGNVLNLDQSQMPSNTVNTTSIGNLRFGAGTTEASNDWNNNSGDRNWNNAANWTAGIPGASEHAVIGLTAPIIGNGISAVAGSVSLDDALEITGGSLDVAEWMALGYEAAGSVLLSDGTLSVGQLLMDGNGLVDVEEGMLVVDGNATNLLNAYVSKGWITAYGGVFIPEVNFDNTNTTVTATEPPLTTTVWNPGAGSNDWATDASWTGGVAPVDQMANFKAVFNVEGAQECLLGSTVTVAHLVIGDNGTTNGAFVRLASGASLTSGISAGGTLSWSGIGYNRNATMTVEAGAVLNSASHLWIGLLSPGVGTLNIEGGTVNVSGQLGLGWQTGSGYINLKSGLLNLAQMDPVKSINGSSIINIEEGTMAIPGDQTAMISNYVAADKIMAYGDTGTVNVSYTGGVTVVTASVPEYGYNAWSQEWGVNIGNGSYDYDSDQKNNFFEYAFNGDPTNAQIIGVQPELISDNGEFYFIHVQRNDDPSLLYQLENSINLISNNWTVSTYPVVGTHVMGAGANYDIVTNGIPVNHTNLFIRLTVEQQ